MIKYGYTFEPEDDMQRVTRDLVFKEINRKKELKKTKMKKEEEKKNESD